MPKLIAATRISPLDLYLSSNEEIRLRGFEVIIPSFSSFADLAQLAALEAGGKDSSISPPVIVISSATLGKGSFTTAEIIESVYTLRAIGYRIVLLPGYAEDENTKAIINAAIGMGVYDFVFDPYTRDNVLFRILNPATVANIDLFLNSTVMEEEEPDASTTPSETKNIKSMTKKIIEKLLPYDRSNTGESAAQAEGENSGNPEKKRDTVCASLINRLFQFKQQQYFKASSGKGLEKPDLTKEVFEPDIDFLTGCYTRRFLQHYRPSENYTVVFIDLDRFKSVNDILGHAAGDQVLAAFGNVLTTNLKGQDIAIRYGGDEFVLILPDTSSSSAEKVLMNLRKAWQKHAPDTGNIIVGFSAGLAEGEGQEGLTDAINAADRLMYKVKYSDRKPGANVNVDREAASSGIGGTQPIITTPPKKECVTLFQLFEQVFKGLFKVAGVMTILSLGILTINFILNLIGKNSPALNASAKFVEEFWRMLFIGFFG